VQREFRETLQFRLSDESLFQPAKPQTGHLIVSRLDSLLDRKSDPPDTRIRMIEALIAACEGAEHLDHLCDAVQRAGDEKQTADIGGGTALQRSANANSHSKGVFSTAGGAVPAANARPLGRLDVAVFVFIFLLGAFLTGIYIGARSGDLQGPRRRPIATASLRARASMVHEDHPVSGTEASVSAASLAKPQAPDSRSAPPAAGAEAEHIATKPKAENLSEPTSEPKVVTPSPKAANPVETNHLGIAAEEQPPLAAGPPHSSSKESPLRTPSEMGKAAGVGKAGASFPANRRTVAVTQPPASDRTAKHLQTSAKVPLATRSPGLLTTDQPSEKPPVRVVRGTEASVSATSLAKPQAPDSRSAPPAAGAKAGHIATKPKAENLSEPKVVTPSPKAANPVETNHLGIAAEEQPPLAAGPPRAGKAGASFPANGRIVAVTQPPASDGTAKHLQTSAKVPLATRSPGPLTTDQKSEKPPVRAGATRSTATEKSASQASRDATAIAAAPKRSLGSRAAQSAAPDVVNPANGSHATSQKSAFVTLPKSAADAAPASVGPHVSTAERRAFLSRGDALLAARDLTSARLFYQYGAEAGDGLAALRLGETFDPVFLRQAHLGAASGDAKEAAYWYRWARGLGNHSAEILLKNLDPTGK
jgi:hypothetical protein